MPTFCNTLAHIFALRAALQVRRIDARAVVAQVHDDGLRRDTLRRHVLHGGSVRLHAVNLTLARAALVPEVHASVAGVGVRTEPYPASRAFIGQLRSEEHTSELQSPLNL